MQVVERQRRRIFDLIQLHFPHENDPLHTPILAESGDELKLVGGGEFFAIFENCGLQIPLF